MPILPNPRHEKFAVNLAQGMSAITAFQMAGFKPHHANASRLMRNDKVVARVGELQGAAAREAGVSIEWIVQELKKVASANVADFVRFDEGGNPITDISGLTREQMAAISGTKLNKRVIKGAEGKPDIETATIDIRMHDKLTALRSLGDHLGMFKNEQPQAGLTINILQADLKL